MENKKFVWIAIDGTEHSSKQEAWDASRRVSIKQDLLYNLDTNGFSTVKALIDTLKDYEFDALIKYILDYARFFSMI